MAEDWREPFERALDADPPDQRVRRDLADHLEERGDPDVEPVRWLADHRRWPLPVAGPAWSWTTRRNARRDRPEVLPHEVHRRLTGTLVYGHRDYPTRREAEADFCRAFHAARAAGWDPAAPA